MPPRRGPASDMIVVLADKKDSDARPVDIRRKGVGDDEITSFASKPEAMRWLASLCSQPSSVIIIGATSAAEAVAELRSKNGDKRTVAYAMPDGAIERVGSKMRLRLAESAIADTVPPVGEGHREHLGERATREGQAGGEGRARTRTGRSTALD